MFLPATSTCGLGRECSQRLLDRLEVPAQLGAGKRIVKDGQSTVAEIPGANLRFAETKEAVAGTQRRAIDHIAFEVKNLEALMKRMAEGGVTVNRAYAAAPAGIAPLKSLAFVTDPWGTYIELNEGFADIQ